MSSSETNPSLGSDIANADAPGDVNDARTPNPPAQQQPNSPAKTLDPTEDQQAEQAQQSQQADALELDQSVPMAPVGQAPQPTAGVSTEGKSDSAKRTVGEGDAKQAPPHPTDVGEAG